MTLALAVPAWAQTAPIARISGPSERVGPWVERLEEQGARLAEDIPDPAPSVDRAELRVLANAEALLVEARQAAVEFDETRALSLLARATDQLERAANIPGVSQWLAEAETITGIVAAQANLAGLSDAALIRAASLDATRVIKPAETAPAVVARARELATARTTALRGRFIVRSNAANARVYLDDAEIGLAPVEVTGTVGRHVLRVAAPGHHTWGRTMDVLEGNRPDVEVSLAPTERRSALNQIARATRMADAGVAASSIGTSVWWLEVGDGLRDRALLYECTAQGCSAPVRISAEGAWRAPRAPIPWSRLPVARRSAWDWMREGTSDIYTPVKPWRRRWQLWVPIAASVAVGIVGLGLGLRPGPDQQFSTSVDCGDLCPPME